MDNLSNPPLRKSLLRIKKIDISNELYAMYVVMIISCRLQGLMQQTRSHMLHWSSTTFWAK